MKQRPLNPIPELRVCTKCSKEYLWDGVHRYAKGQSKGFDFKRFCSKECAKSVAVTNMQNSKIEKYGTKGYNNQEKRRATLKDRYGSENYSNIEKGRQTMLERYGVERPLQDLKIKEKRKITNIEKYGVESVLQSAEIRNKGRTTKKEKYGLETFNNQEKRKSTLMERYGSRNFTNREKYKMTCLERYGVEHSASVAEYKAKQKITWLRKYGGIGFAVKEIKEKSQKTRLEKYGNADYTNIKQAIKTMRERYGVVGWEDKKRLIKGKATMLKKYGTIYYSQTQMLKDLYKNPEFVKQKQYRDYMTKKKNNSFHISKVEQIIKLMLEKKWPDSIYQYKTEIYPWVCDFYIPNLDLYIEIQRHCCHGSEPFNPDNVEHQQLVEIWKEKSKEINIFGKPKRLYERMINGWTVRDPMKRQWAKDHNLNWLEFFTIEQFKIWYNKP